MLPFLLTVWRANFAVLSSHLRPAPEQVVIDRRQLNDSRMAGHVNGQSLNRRVQIE
jgi:hypothetical protein